MPTKRRINRQNKNKQGIKDILRRKDIVKFTKRSDKDGMGMLKDCNTKERQSKLRQLQWKKEGIEEDQVQDGETTLKRIWM